MFEEVHIVAGRATCSTRPAGAILVTSNGTQFEGYEGAPHGIAHCDALGCPLLDEWCQHAVRAELNAIGRAARAQSASTVGATLYVSEPVATGAVGLIINVGVAKVVCPGPVARSVQETFALANIELEVLSQ